MPHLNLNLPPVAQAVAVILGVALAIVRLLTASKPFWNVLPNKLQKAIPALLVAAGLLPAALQHAQSWLDVVVALVLVVGSYFTASRGDQSPPKDSDGGPRTDRVNSDPRLTREELAPPPSIRPPGGMDAEFRAWCPLLQLLPLGGAALACLVGLVLVACGAPLPDPCSRVSLATITAGCEVRIKSECEQGDESCPAYLECSKAVKAWKECVP